MRLDELRPCDACGGPVNPVFFALRVEQKVVNQNAVREHVGLAQFFGSSRLASVFDAHGDGAVQTTTQQELVLCTGCFCAATEVAGAWEQRNKIDAAETDHATENARQAQDGGA